jgi:hypothetical protein
MNNFNLTSNYGHIHIGFLYLGWNNNTSQPVNDTDCGDESFGFAIGNFYVGCYSDGKWCAGFLNEYGCLD